MRSKIASRILQSTPDNVRQDVMDYANELVSMNTLIIPIEKFKANPDFAKRVLDQYNDAKEKNSSWFGPKIPFWISRPKLITNAHTAKKALKSG